MSLAVWCGVVWSVLELNYLCEENTRPRLTPLLFQSPSPSLQDAICVVLSRLKVSNTLANMENIIARLKSDYSQIPAPRDFVQLVHVTLGSLIKARKVYYTGKGYFLVQPEVGAVASWQDQHRNIYNRAGGGGLGGGGGGGGSESSTQTECSRGSPGRVRESGNNTSLTSEDSNNGSNKLEHESHLHSSALYLGLLTWFILQGNVRYSCLFQQVSDFISSSLE